MPETIKDRVVKDEESQKEWNKSYPKLAGPWIVRFESKDNQVRLIPVELSKQRITEEEGIFLVYDELYKVNQDEFGLLKDQCSGDTLYILAHKNGVYPTEKFAGWGCKGYKEESHLPDSENSYSKFFDILTDSEDLKMERIINKVFTPNLEIVLRFLHQCLFPNSDIDSGVSELKPALLEKLPDNSDAKKALRNYTTNTGEKFEELRDKLLEFALNNH